MGRNRKSQSASVRFGPALKAVFLCLCMGGSGVGYVWQKNQLHDLGRQIKERENRLGDLVRENKLRRMHLDSLCSPVALDQRVRTLNLGLVRPPVGQIVHLTDRPEMAEGSGARGGAHLTQVAR